MAAQQAIDPQPETTDNTVLLHSLVGVLGTGGDKATTWREHGRDNPLIETNQSQNDKLGDLHADSFSATNS